MSTVSFLSSVWLSDESWEYYAHVTSYKRKLVRSQCLWLELEPVWLCSNGG